MSQATGNLDEKYLVQEGDYGLGKVVAGVRYHMISFNLSRPQLPIPKPRYAIRFEFEFGVGVGSRG